MMVPILHQVRRIPYLFIYVGVFVAFLITGIGGGRLIGTSDVVNSTITQMPYSSEPISETAEFPNNGQHNLLVIGVDQLSTTRPQLEGIWLVMSLQDKPDFTFLPLFPQPNEKNNFATSDLTSNFSLDNNGRPSEAFLKLLKHQVWWSNYLVIDQDSLITVIDLLGGLKQGSIYLKGTDVLATLPSTWKDSSIAYTSQVKLISQLCDQAQAFSISRKLIAATLRKVDANLSTDLNLLKMLDTWFIKSRDQHSIRCEFPLLSSSVP